MKRPVEFATEADLCAAFIAALPNDWTAYPETGGFDILLVRAYDGFQIGVEAKLRLNAKVICQAAEPLSHWNVDRPAPDCRAVLVPSSYGSDLAAICPLIGVTVIHMAGAAERYSRGYRPELPSLKNPYLGDSWYEMAPLIRLPVPDYVPDVVAGAPAPQQLWTQMRWIIPSGNGAWIANAVPDFRAQHPVNFPQIEADYEKWRNRASEPEPKKQEALAL